MIIRTPFPPAAAGTGMGVLTIIRACVLAAALAIWGTASLAAGEFVHPWFLYIVGPPGAVPVVLYAFGIGRPPAR